MSNSNEPNLGDLNALIRHNILRVEVLKMAITSLNASRAEMSPEDEKYCEFTRQRILQTHCALVDTFELCKSGQSEEAFAMLSELRIKP